MNEYTEDDLLSAVQSELSSALGSNQSEISRQRGEAMEYYLGRPYGNEESDRSSVVTREVMDTVEWIMPEMMKIFASGAETVRFEPQTVDDVPEAEQKTDYINYLFHRKNPGFVILYQWVKDGLLQKNGYVKATWQKDASKRREEYIGLTEAELLSLAERDEVEVIQKRSYDSPLAASEREKALEQANAAMAQVPPEQQQQAQMALQQQFSQPLPQIHDVVIHRAMPDEGLVIEPIPPEEFVISDGAKSIEDADFCAHVRDITISELRKMGYDVDDDVGGGSHDMRNSDEKIARHSYDQSLPSDSKTPHDASMREVQVAESYIYFDLDNDGIAELLKVVTVGDEILEQEEVDCKPFAGWTPIMLSHKHIGLSMADLTMDLQRIQSQLFRNMLDNQYLTNNGRYVALDGMVNMDDLMSSRPHGIVRAKAMNAVSRLDTPQLGNTAFQMLAYVDQLREKRTGVSERTQGLDPNSLSANTAATAVNQVMTAAQQRIELIARVFGETGLTDLFRLMHKIVIQNQTQPEIFRLRDQYVEVNPSDWTDRADTSVVVGLGNGSREQEMLQHNMIFQNQMQLLTNPATSALVQPVNLYNTLEDQVKVFDKASAGRYFTDPNSPQAQQAAQQQAQQQQQMQQMQMQLQQQQLQMQQMVNSIKQFEAQSKDQNEKARIQLEAQDLARKGDEFVQEHDLDERRHIAEVQIETSQKRAADIG